ncbi:MAG: phosphodiester glycosidase family protein [Bacteroidales bacterium]|nr:phosphodiester glycosidase family protein [Bacteroidales bacterium]
MREAEPASSEAQEITIRVSIPQKQDTKVSLTTTYNRQALCLAWKEGDELSINEKIFTATNIISDHEAEFTGDTPDGFEFTIIYPGKYTSVTEFYERSYSSQKQIGNSSTSHLEYNAMLSNVTEYDRPMFDAQWADDNGGGALEQNGVIQMRLQLPDGVSSANSVALIASRPVFSVTNEGNVKSDHQTLVLEGCGLSSNRILEAYMMFSSAGITWQAGDRLTVAVDTPDAMYCRTLDMNAQSWNGGGEYTIQCKVTAENNIAISSVSDLETFRDGVNNGNFLCQWGHVTLENNLDCSSVAGWTPIGDGTFTSNTFEVSGTPFHGTFDGKGHALLNLQMNGTPAENAPYGFFGILDGATVKDLVFGAAAADEGYFRVTPSGAMEAGIVAGVCRASSIKNVTNYSPMSILENTSSAAAFFGMVGYVLGTEDVGSTLDNVDNHGAVSAHGGSNSENGATGFNVAAIAGFSNTSNSSIRNTIENCDNHGAVTTSTGRAAGIVAGANARTQLLGCTNRGDVEDSFANARVGGICALLGNNSWMNECSNYGKVITSNSNGQAGGLACLINQEDVVISGGGNHGLILCDASYRGTLVANFNNFKSVSDVIAGGAIATYSSTAPNHIGSYSIITETNYMDFTGGGLNDEKLNKITGVDYEAWNDYPDGSVTYISNAAQLLAFATAVNSGGPEISGMAVLTEDIDCTDIDDWTPIGDCGMSAWTHTDLTTTGKLFSGTFDGQGHTISNLDMSFSSSGSWKAYGFFGGLGDGAVVKDLTFDSSCSMNVSASYGSCFGVLAGLVKGATIENVVSYAAVTGGGTNALGNNNAAGRTMVGGIIGEVHVSAQAARLTGLYNYGPVGSVGSEFSRGNNAGNGANGFHVGGIAGFSTNTNNSRAVIFTDCHNYADIYTDAGRSSGIIAACNRYTKLDGCINRGNMVSSANGTFRLGNITCIAGTGSELIGCINYGDLTALNNVSVAGVVCLVNHATVKVTNCASLGATLLGKSVNINGNQTYNGVLFGYCNYDASFSGCRVSGVIGTSALNTVTLTSENYFQFVGQATATATQCTSENIAFDGSSPAGNGISSAADLVNFATAFNSGGDVSSFLVDGKVKLNNDIDATSITNWVPIGSTQPLNIDFNGNGKTIYNVNWTVDATQAESLGLIGCAQDITIRDLTLGSKDSRITFSGNRSRIRAGGVVGRALGVTITNVVNKTDLNVTGTSATGNDLHLGGIAGYADGSSTIGGDADDKGCVNNGNVSASVAGCVGGLAGYNAGAISHSTNKGNISCPSSGNYGPAWLCSHNATKTKLTSNSGYGLVGGSPAMIRNAVKDNCESYLDPESVTVDWTLDNYYDWTEVESRDLHSGATYHHYSFTNLPREMFVLEIDLSNPGIELTAALAGDMIPNPNGLLDNDHNYQLNTIRERLSDVCTRRRAEGENILAGVNAGFFDTHEGTLRGFHVENGEPLYINNPDCVNKLPNHKWGLTVFKDGTASVGVKKFTGKMRAAGKEFDYYSVNDTILRSTHTESAAKYQANLYTSHYKKQPYNDHPELVNTLTSDALYVICQWDGNPMTVNTGYARATVTEVRDGRAGSITTPQITAANKFVIALSGKMAQQWSEFVSVGLKVELNCTITVGGISKPILTQVSTMYQLMTDGRDASDTPGQNASLYSAYDPMTYPIVSKDGTKVWLVEIDGRQGWYSMGVKGYEMYRIAKKLGGWWATRLDGGGSSCAWVWNGSSGSIVSRPYDNPGGERSCMNYLLVRAKD